MSSTQHDNLERLPNPDYKSSDALIASKKPQRQGSAGAETSTLRFRHRALLFLCLYVPLLIIPWCLTCVLVFRPIDQPSYYDLQGLSENTLTLHRRLVSAINVINSVTSIITVPLISALIAQAAVVHAQKRRRNQSLSVLQTFALADRGWSNLGILFQAWPPWKTSDSRSRTAGSSFLWVAAFFLLECMITIPIREGVTSATPMLVMSARDHTSWSGQGFSRTFPVGHDAEPYDMATVPEDNVVQDVINSLASLSSSDVPSNLWTDYDGPFPFTASSLFIDHLADDAFGPWKQPTKDFFVAALTNGTTTGVMRHRIMRFNSTVTGKKIEQATFQETCKGDNGFSTTFIRDGQLEIRLCVPGSRSMRWTLSRNRQKIAEDFFLDVKQFTSMPSSNATNFTRQYTVQTSRSYFEPGNYRTDMVQGPLLERWDEIDPYNKSTQYNDRMSKFWRDDNYYDNIVRRFAGRYRLPTVEDKLTDIPGWPAPQFLMSPWPRLPGSSDANRTAGGPLMMSILAMFGEKSLFAIANQTTNSTAQDVVSQICDTARMPFSNFFSYQMFSKECALRNGNGAMSSEDLLTALVSRFVTYLFEDDWFGRRYLSAGSFFANRAMLLQTIEKTAQTTARPIYSAPGQYLQKPTISMAGIAIVSVLIFLQLLGLVYLAWYIYQVPIWTAVLDALAVARITNSLDKGDIPAIGSLSAEDILTLGSKDGLVGIVEEQEGLRDCEPKSQIREVELGLGASGLFHRHLVKFRMRRAAIRLGSYTDADCNCEGCTRRRVASENDSRHSLSSRK